MKNKKLFPVMGEETPDLKYGDIFTITADQTARNWEMVCYNDNPKDLKKFVLVPQAYSANKKLAKRWDSAIKKAELNNLKRVTLC